MITNQLEIRVPYPNTDISELRLTLAACRLTLHPDEGETWVAGTYDDLEGAMPLTAQQDGIALRITRRETLAENFRLTHRLSPLNLALYKDRPFALHMEAGLLDGSLDLSGLPLTRLNVRHGDGNQSVQFDTPNPQPMGLESANVWGYFALILALFFINTMGEELWWRGYIYPRQELAHGSRTWIIHFAMWTLFHVFEYWRLLEIIMVTLPFSYITHRTRSTWPGILIHGLRNAIDMSLLTLIVFGILA